jgi:anti-anti-sigma factor
MNQQSLTIQAFEEPGRYVLTLGGELDLAGVAAFEAAATRLAGMGQGELLVDITDVSFIDSNGVRAILAVKAGCEKRQCAFSMTHGSESAERIFELTKLLDHLPFRRRQVERFRREIELWPEDSGAFGDEPG